MAQQSAYLVRSALGILCAFALGVTAASAQSFSNQREEQYYPTTWVDPDGCEHWVMDDGAEGYMSPKYHADGRPACGGAQPAATCGRLTDQYFHTDSYQISPSGVSRLRNFFSANRGQRFIIVGHTDSRASHAYNDRLSLNRARSVASVAQSVGAPIVEVKGMGENQPVATNATAEGRAQNRRVDILCVNGSGGATSYVPAAQPYVEPAPRYVAPAPQPAAPSYTGRVCGRLSNQYFATDKYYISQEGRSQLAQFFTANQGQRFAIVGHTDSRASDAYNIRLSQNRANAVAGVGRSVGANIVDVRGMGERQPIATNSTVVGMAQNRRVDIICVE